MLQSYKVNVCLQPSVDIVEFVQLKKAIFFIVDLREISSSLYEELEKKLTFFEKKMLKDSRNLCFSINVNQNIIFFLFIYLFKQTNYKLEKRQQQLPCCVYLIKSASDGLWVFLDG